MVNDFPAWNVDGGADDPVLILAADLSHDRPGADELLVASLAAAIAIPLLDADAAGAVRSLHPHRL